MIKHCLYLYRYDAVTTADVQRRFKQIFPKSLHEDLYVFQYQCYYNVKIKLWIQLIFLSWRWVHGSDSASRSRRLGETTESSRLTGCVTPRDYTWSMITVWVKLSISISVILEMNCYWLPNTWFCCCLRWLSSL